MRLCKHGYERGDFKKKKGGGNFLISWMTIASPKESLPWSEKDKRFT